MKLSLRQWLEKGPFTLSMSAGFFGFYSHCGFVKALFEEGFKPQKYTGSSAGALVGSLLAAGQSPFHIEEILKKMRKEHFWDLKLGPGLLAGQKFDKLLCEYLPSQFEDLQKKLAVSTFEMARLKTKVFSSGDLRSSVRASCCFPILFHPVEIQGRRYIDGGIADWSGLQGVDQEERTLIHLIEPEGFMSNYLKKKAYSQIKNQDHHVLVIPDKVAMGPNRMHLAEQAIQTSYTQTKQALTTLL